MGTTTGFLEIAREGPARRPVDERVRDYRHVYLPLAAPALRDQASRCMDCGVPFCNTGCPLGNLIPDWNDLVYRDRWQQAIARLHLTNNFPEFTGLLCPAPCEAACVLSLNDDPVTIKEVELAIVNRAWDEGWIRPRRPACRTGRRVAVIGSGPTGLAAAQELNRAGHHVTVFEKDDRIGGLLRYGIPDFKIEKWVVDRRLDLLAAEGVEFAPNSHAGVNPTVEMLRQEFDAIMLAVGALQQRDLPVPGRELAGIHAAMDYLTQQNRRVAGEPVDPEIAITAAGKRVVILGGGDTSADCLGNVHRDAGSPDPGRCASVQVLTHGPRPPDEPHPLEWPDWPFILRSYAAHEEGGDRCWSVVVTGFSGSEGRVERIHLAEAERLPDGHTRQIPGTDRLLEADLVLLAIGFDGPVRDRLLADLDVEYGPDGAIAADKRYLTAAPDVWVAGDARRGASLIVWAIAEGRKAAAEVDRSLSGKG
jgi:glutamate synthase (NADPH/NADH) small chain